MSEMGDIKGPGDPRLFSDQVLKTQIANAKARIASDQQIIRVLQRILDERQQES